MTAVPDGTKSAHKILKVRRHYNQWVADQTLEDYALRFTARKGRTMSIGMVGRTALAATAFLALEALAAAVTLAYGFVNAVAAILVVCLIFFVTGLPIAYYSAKHGLDIDLLTRGAGFGYLGSTLTSLIYASFTFIFFAIEAAILSSALNLLFGIPLALAYLICAGAVIPIVIRGITAISRFQLGTQSLWLVLQIAALLVVVFNEWQQLGAWVDYSPVSVPGSHQFNWVMFGAAASILFALVAQIGEQVDYLRFMPEKTPDNSRRWWFWLVLAGPGWVSVGLVKMLLGSFLAFVAVSQGIDALSAADPTLMYQRAFGYLIQSDRLALILAALMVIVSQMKINVTNAYAGSIAWSNFFSRLTHSHPGRVVWLVFNVALALLLMELGVHQALESVLSVFALVAVSWLCCLSADLMINKPLGLSPKQIEFKRGHLYDINPVGTVSMALATAVGLCAYLGLFGEGLKTLGHFLSIATSFVLVPLIAWLTEGKYYLARSAPEPIVSTSDEPPSAAVDQHCSLCQNHFEPEDVLYCPAYQQTICSLCCSLDARCLDQCKPPVEATSTTLRWFKKVLPPWLTEQLLGRSGQFLIWFALVNLFIGALLALIYRHMELQGHGDLTVFASGLWTLFFTLMIVSGVVTWLFLLAHESRVEAQRESNLQTQKLIEEIGAHKSTDSQLQQAKELAERANAAKSRYLSGISHELRTPLQSILGYTQLLSDRKDTPKTHRPGLNTIHRSGQYLADLIEGLLDVSKIEAGRLNLHISQFAFPGLIHQLAYMFQMQAQSKGIELKLVLHDPLPAWVRADEKRLRQVLINLLSNAIKYTEQGSVEFHVRYRNQVAQFTVIDTGVGIAESEQERIFSPFERVQNSATAHVPGTGLGLTIVKLLVEIMGGDIQLTSALGTGSQFKVALMLPWAEHDPAEVAPQRRIEGYQGTRRTIMVVDDDATVRGLINELLQPLGFNVLEAVSAEQCLADFAGSGADLYILDVNMPGKSGFELTALLRADGIKAPIVMLSANAQIPDTDRQQQLGFDQYLVKPLDNYRLLSSLATLLEVHWLYSDDNADSRAPLDEPATNAYQPPAAPAPIRIVQGPLLEALFSAADIGYKRGMLTALADLYDQDALDQADYDRLVERVERLQFSQLSKMIEVV